MKCSHLSPLCHDHQQVAIQLAACLAILGLAVNSVATGVEARLSDIVLLGSVVAVHAAVVMLHSAVDVALRNEQRMEYPLPDDQELYSLDFDGLASPRFPVIWTPRRSEEVASLRRSIHLVDTSCRQLTHRLSLSLARLGTDTESVSRSSAQSRLSLQQHRVVM